MAVSRDAESPRPSPGGKEEAPVPTPGMSGDLSRGSPSRAGLSVRRSSGAAVLGLPDAAAADHSTGTGLAQPVSARCPWPALGAREKGGGRAHVPGSAFVIFPVKTRALGHKRDSRPLLLPWGRLPLVSRVILEGGNS